MISAALAALLFLTGPAASAEETVSSVVQQGLTVHEIDKELSRLKARQAELNEEIPLQRTAVEEQSLLVKKRSEHAGKVLRAMYMGKRDKLWQLLFYSKSISEAIVVLDYLKAIISNDYRLLTLYKEAYQEEQRLLSELVKQQEELQTVIAAYELQRERLLAEQAELERQLAELNEEERAAELEAIAALTTLWEQEGIPTVANVLLHLSEAMKNLQLLLSDPTLIEVRGATLVINLTDDKFNGFLRDQNSFFSDYTFTFGIDGMSVTGQTGEHTAMIRGQYILQQTPVNLLQFRIEQILFNGYDLPDTTRNELQEQYDMSFEPGKLVEGLTVTGLTNEEGRLVVELAFQ